MGVGGFGRKVLQLACQAWPERVAKIAGFLSAARDKLASHANRLPIGGSQADFFPRPTANLILAIGVPHVGRQVGDPLKAKAGKFLTLIHATAIVADTAENGIGSIVCPHEIVSNAVLLGRFVLLNYHSSLEHDASAGDFSVFSPYATLRGEARVEADVFLGLHASVGPSRTVGAAASVAANSCALANAPPASLVFGVPGLVTSKVLPST